MSEVEICQLAYSGNCDLLKLKISQDNALVNKVDQSGRCALHWACSGGHGAIVEFLVLHCGQEVDVRDEPNWTPLMISTSAGRENLVKFLLSRGAQVNAVNSNGQCSLHYAASKDHFKIAEMLLENGASANIADWMSCTPLHRAASKGHCTMSKLLLSYNADPNHQDNVGHTPLHLSCEEERSEQAKLLIEHGAIPSLRNRDEKTCYDLAPVNLRKQLKRIADGENPT